jgi:CRISPR-associated protein Cas5t
MVSVGINQPSTLNYWGLPFLGDNNFFVERLDVVNQPTSCRWLRPLRQNEMPQGDRLFYLSVWTNYETNLKSNSQLFLLTEKLDEAWVEIEERK